MPVPASRLSLWLRTPFGVAAYSLAWTVFGVGVATARWFARPELAGAATAALMVVTPAAVLGLAAIRLAEIWPLWDARRRWLPVAHGALAVGYAVAWTAGVSLLGSVARVLQGGEFRVNTPPEHVLHWHLLAGVLLYAVLAGAAFAHRQVVAAARAQQRAESRLAAAQLNPHFLANTLHALSALVRTDARRGEAAFDQLRALLHYVLRVQRDDDRLVRFDEEWRFIQQYVALEALATDGELHLESRIDEDVFDVLVPPLLLQPLVENAVRHGIRSTGSSGTVTVGAAFEGGRLVFEVIDDGPGVELSDPADGTRLGLRAVRTRIGMAWGESARLRLGPAVGSGFSARIEVLVEAVMAGQAEGDA